MFTVLNFLIAFGVLGLMIAGYFLIRPRKRNAQIQINIDFDAKKALRVNVDSSAYISG